ncbi:hypothetical protein R3W88_014385 [Solanum pinnatisectum]|uniref:Lipoxygenase domain-containing protein n=1 Tax=Solanum pinnatisectum TaxID=50273 RepID=A0AAV9KRK3_9SOLN|nr:hypothetical protein R3W88_014385 [Solanum pinnatisectum]
MNRGMAVEDPTAPCGVKLVIEDYPYAADGFLIWSAIKELVESYVEHYYSEPISVMLDYPLAGYVLHCPTLMRKLIPQVKELEYK